MFRLHRQEKELLKLDGKSTQHLEERNGLGVRTKRDQKKKKPKRLC